MGFFADNAGKATESGNLLPASCGLIELSLIEPMTIKTSRKDEGAYIQTVDVRVEAVIQPGKNAVTLGGAYRILNKIPAKVSSQGPGLGKLQALVKAFCEMPEAIKKQAPADQNVWAGQQADRALAGSPIGKIGKRVRCTVSEETDKSGNVYVKIQFDAAEGTGQPVTNTQNSKPAAQDDDL